MTYFMLNPECYLIKGAKRGAIYNLHTGQIFSTGPELTALLDACEGRKSLEEALKIVPSSDEAMETLNKLWKWRLGRFYETEKVAPIIEKLKPPMTKRQRREQFIKPSLVHLFLELTGECNLDCLFCDRESNNVRRMTGCKRWLGDNSRKGTLQLKDWVKIIRDGERLRCKSLQFVGGEPLLVWDILFQVIQLAKNLGYEHIRVDTNGVLLDDEKVRFLVDHDVMTVLQIFSFKQNVHDGITQVAGSFEKTVHNIQQLMDHSARYSFILPIMKHNQDHWEETVEWFQGYGPEQIRTDILRPHKMKNTDDVADQLISKLYRTSKGTFGKIDRSVFFQWCEGHPCWEGKLAVTCWGDVLPCPMAREEIIANIHKTDLREVFRDEDMNTYWDMTKDDVEVCGNCEYRYACFDCRPIDKSDSGKLEGKSKYCTYDPLQGEWKTLR